MISRRFLLSAAPAALVAAWRPVKALGPPEIVTTPAATTWGAGTAAIETEFSRSAAYWAAARYSVMTVDEIRRAEGLPLPSFSLEELLR